MIHDPVIYGGTPADEAGSCASLSVARSHPEYGVVFQHGTGTLIHGCHILTAAHVIHGAGKLRYIQAILGTTDRTSSAAWRANALKEGVVTHALYESQRRGNLRADLALFAVDAAIASRVPSARIARRLPQRGETLIAKGWGVTANGSRAVHLQSGLFRVLEAHPAILLLTPAKGTRSSVMDGDSGGPIFNMDGEIVGVISHRLHNTEPSYSKPGVQSAAIPLPSYRDWLEAAHGLIA